MGSTGALQAALLAHAAGLLEETRRKVFISFHHGDRPEVDTFIGQWVTRENVFIPKAIGVSYNDDLIKSTDAQYVMSQIRAKYLGDSTVTIVLMGACTHGRRYVDWEIKASLRQGETLPNGLLGIVLPSQGKNAHLPPRFQDNWPQDQEKRYAQYKVAPQSAGELRSWIEDVYKARTSRAHLISNQQDIMSRNMVCKVCGVTH